MSTLTAISDAIIDRRDMDAVRLLVDENLRLTRELRKFVRWFDTEIERRACDEERDTAMFTALRDMRDTAQAVLTGVSHL